MKGDVTQLQPTGACLKHTPTPNPDCLYCHRHTLLFKSGWLLDREQPEDGWRVVAWREPARGEPRTFASIELLVTFLESEVAAL